MMTTSAITSLGFILAVRSAPCTYVRTMSRRGGGWSEPDELGEWWRWRSRWRRVGDICGVVVFPSLVFGCSFQSFNAVWNADVLDNKPVAMTGTVAVSDSGMRQQRKLNDDAKVGFEAIRKL